MRYESVFETDQALGPDLNYNDMVDVSGQLSQKQLKAFAKARRNSSMGPTTIFYAGVTAPAVSAGVGSLTLVTLAQTGWGDQSAMLASSILAAMAGISWYLIFMRWGTRGGMGRDDELMDETRVIVDGCGVELIRGEVRTLIGWKAVEDITISTNYIALIIDGANDILLPMEWFGSKDEMKEAARKISSLRPPPFAG